MACPNCSLPLQASTTNYGIDHISCSQKDRSLVNKTKVVINGKSDYYVYEAYRGERGWAKIILQPQHPCKNCGKEPESDIITGNVKFIREQL